MAENTRTTAKENGPHPLDFALGRRIKARRRELGLSQQDLGTGCGVTFQQVHKMERGTNRVSFSRLCMIAAALRQTPAELIGDIGKVP